MPPIPLDPKVGDTIYCAIGAEAHQVRAVEITDTKVLWEDVHSDKTGSLNISAWIQFAAVQRVIIEYLKMELEHVAERNANEIDLIAAIKKISHLCRTVGQMEGLSRQFATKIIANAASDLRRIQQICYDVIGYIAPENPT
jgi:hypothetical protein